MGGSGNALTFEPALQIGAKAVGHGFEHGHVGIAEGVAGAGKGGDDAADAHAAQDGHNGHGFDTKSAANFCVDAGVVFSVVAAYRFHSGNGQARERTVETKNHSDVWSIIAAAGAADHFIAEGDGSPRCSRERLDSLGEFVDVLEDGWRELDLRSGVLCNGIRHIGLLDAGSSCCTKNPYHK